MENYPYFLSPVSKSQNSNGAMIRLGLGRITRLLDGVHLTWKAIHVAGTNGKGSICAYLSAMLHDNNIRVGRFTSPHIIDRWDGITVDEKPIAKDLFLEVEDCVKWRNEKESIDATSFELMTATAYHIFNLQKVQVGVVECGMGGRLDATNVFKKPLVTVISRIGLDHQEFLGNTYHAIATEKAGIMKRGTPCVIDALNNDLSTGALLNVAASKGVEVHFTPVVERLRRKYVPKSTYGNDRAELFVGLRPYPHYIQQDNMWCAYRTFALAMPQLGIKNVENQRLAKVMNNANLPGRLQQLNMRKITGRQKPVFLDGGHNAQAWDRLGTGFNKLCLGQSTLDGRVWIIACSKGRDPAFLIQHFRPNDTVIVVEFGPVDGMPWVEPLPATSYEPIKAGDPNWINMGRDIHGALLRATKIAKEGPLIIMGSLYLVADVLRIVRKPKPAGPKNHKVEVTPDIQEYNAWKDKYFSRMNSTRTESPQTPETFQVDYGEVVSFDDGSENLSASESSELIIGNHSKPRRTSAARTPDVTPSKDTTIKSAET